MSTRTEQRRDERDREYGGHVRPVSKRPVPFLGSLLVAFGVLPCLYAVSRWVYLWDPPTGTMVANMWFLSGAVLALVAIGIGLFHAKRTSFLIKHVSLTVLVVGLGGNLYTLLGWRYRFMDVAAVFTAAMLWGSWMLYRIDAFRAKATGETADGWGEILGLARSRPKKIRTTETQVIVDVEHGPGETVKDVRHAAEKLEDAAGAIVGRTTVTPHERGGGSTIALTMADPFEQWRRFPGLSHPGGLFAHPFRTAYYATGEDQWFGFAPGRVSPHTGFVAPSATFVGLVGTTGVGKSGEENNIAAEGLSRRHTIVCWVDAEKLFANAGWCLDMLGMAAKNREQAKRLSRALRHLAEYRVELFGQMSLDAALDPDDPTVGGREWTDELCEETGEAAILVIMDEADTFLSRGEWDWLGKRGRQLGIFLVPSVPRASTTEVPAAFRGSIAAWKTFAIGDKYSGEFTLSQKARDGGADPESLRIVGAHYFDLVPGVPERMWPVLCRAFWSDGPTMLRPMVQRARATFTPATFTDNAIMWMGEDYAACTPDAVLALRGPRRDAGQDPGPEDEPDAEMTQQLPAAGGDRGEEGDEDVEQIERTVDGAREPDGDDGVVATLAHPGLPDDRESDPREPWTITSTGVEVPEDKPAAPSPEQEEADVDAAIVQLAGEGLSEFAPEDMTARMRYAMQPWTVSRRLGALCESERIIPPGVKLERIRPGRYLLVRTGPWPRPSTIKREGEH